MLMVTTSTQALASFLWKSCWPLLQMWSPGLGSFARQRTRSALWFRPWMMKAIVPQGLLPLQRWRRSRSRRFGGSNIIIIRKDVHKS